MTQTAAFPRLAFEQLNDELRALLGPTVQRVGYFGDFFAVLGHSPAALLGFMDYTKAVKTPLAERHNEVLALVVCARTGADYERIQHERLSQRLGFPLPWIAELIGRGQGEASLLDDDERALVALAEAVVARGGHSVGAELDRVRIRLGEPAALAAVLQIARFMMIATLLHAFDMRLPVPSVFDG